MSLALHLALIHPSAWRSPTASVRPFVGYPSSKARKGAG
jgi:hypothetical protein